jgi:hypothetical protein
MTCLPRRSLFPDSSRPILIYLTGDASGRRRLTALQPLDHLHTPGSVYQKRILCGRLHGRLPVSKYET